MKWFLLVLNRYAEFNGRSRRKEYWYFTLFSMIFSFVFTLVGIYMNIEYLDTIFSLAILIPSLAVGVRRMHDVNKSGWYVLIPIYNLILACENGTDGPNDYGSDPKRSELEDEIDMIGSN